MSFFNEVVEEWFSQNSVSCLNIVTVVIILKQQDNSLDIEEGFQLVINKLHTDDKIIMEDIYELKIKYEQFKKAGLIKDFINIIVQIGDNPNLIYPDRWTPHTTKTKIKNKCFPCKSTT